MSNYRTGHPSYSERFALAAQWSISPQRVGMRDFWYRAELLLFAAATLFLLAGSIVGFGRGEAAALVLVLPASAFAAGAVALWRGEHLLRLRAPEEMLLLSGEEDPDLASWDRPSPDYDSAR